MPLWVWWSLQLLKLLLWVAVLLHLRLRKCVPLPYSLPWFHSGILRLHVPPVPCRLPWRACCCLGKLRHSSAVGWLPCLYLPWQLPDGCLWCWEPQAVYCLLLFLHIVGLPPFLVIAWCPLCLKDCLCLMKYLFVDFIHSLWVFCAWRESCGFLGFWWSYFWRSSCI